jgi:hypothetical protein
MLSFSSLRPKTRVLDIDGFCLITYRWEKKEGSQITGDSDNDALIKLEDARSLH